MNYLDRSAVISDCGRFRYSLRRTWQQRLFGDKGVCAFAMLNPSTADGKEDDATIRKVVGFANRWGYSGLVVVNVFAYRATDPDELLNPPVDPVGPDADFHTLKALAGVSLIVAGWGSHRALRHPPREGRVTRFLEVLRETGAPVQALKLSKQGNPYHPLYLPNDSKPFDFELPRAA
jgi:hypothetical protein